MLPQEIFSSDLLEGHLVNSRAPIYSRTHLHASFYRISVNWLRVRSKILHDQTGLQSCNQTRLDSGDFNGSNARRCIKSFGGQKGGLSKPP